jgi:hypothetical protein
MEAVAFFRVVLLLQLDATANLPDLGAVPW